MSLRQSARASFDLFRRHVRNRPHHRTRHRHVGEHARRMSVGCRKHRIGRLGETEVEQLHAGTRDHDVAGFQIAMDDVLAVGGVKRRRDVGAVANDVRQRERAASQPILERFSSRNSITM